MKRNMFTPLLFGIMTFALYLIVSALPATAQTTTTPRVDKSAAMGALVSAMDAINDPNNLANANVGDPDRATNAINRAIGSIAESLDDANAVSLALENGEDVSPVEQDAVQDVFNAIILGGILVMMGL